MPVSMLKANKKSAETKKITLDYGKDGDLNLEINADKFTKGLQRKVKVAAAENDVVTIIDLFLGVVESWDMLDENGDVIPLTEEATDEISISTLLSIMTKIGEAATPKDQTAS